MRFWDHKQKKSKIESGHKNRLNPRNTRRFSVLGNEYRVLVSEYRDTEKWVLRAKNSTEPQTETRALRVVWGAKVHPKLPRKIIGEAYFPVLASGKNISLKPKNQVFLPWELCLGAQNTDQKFQKWVSDTSTGQKQYIFTHITSKNHVLNPSDTPQLKLKTGPCLKNQV